MADIFLSYASQDRERIRPLVNILQQQGWTVWWDRKIPPGKTYDQVIEEALDASACVVVVWSEHSVKSDWVRVEANEGLTRKILVPTLIDKVKPPLAFRLIQGGSLIDWKGEASHPTFKEFFVAIGAVLGGTKSAFISDFVTVDEKGKIIKNSAKYVIEDLDHLVTLEMIGVPGGTFLMGSPNTEKHRSESEGPQHQVTVPPFAIGKFQVTQAQWRVVADFPKVKRVLNPERSFFKGDDLPVESVSWDDAVEFCKGLGQLHRFFSVRVSRRSW